MGLLEGLTRVIVFILCPLREWKRDCPANSSCALVQDGKLKPIPGLDRRASRSNLKASTSARRIPASNGVANSKERDGNLNRTNNPLSSFLYNSSRSLSDCGLTNATTATESPSVDTITSSGVFSSFHLMKKRIASSSDEIMFVLAVERFGPTIATYLADKFHWQCQRPLLALRAMIDESGKSYTK